MLENLGRHGDAPGWDAALATLAEITARLPADAKLPTRQEPWRSSGPAGASEIPAIGLDSSASQPLQMQLTATLQQLHPWRKGPWWLHGVHVDTEWRSDWKWQRLCHFLPDLRGQRILDVGCGNGYYGWQMLNAGASEVIGIDPTVLFVYQHLAANRLLAPLYPGASNRVLPLRLEDLPARTHSGPSGQLFDTVFSMGVLYHRRDHMAHLRQLRDQLRPGGTLVLETLICEHTDLRPDGRYARMRNVHLLPQPETVSHWLDELGFSHTTVRDLTATTLAEQRSTPWMRFESLPQALDSANPGLTIEGHPAPARACFVAHWAP